MNIDKKLILASNSPRRKEILTSAGFKFEILVRETNEEFDSNMDYNLVPEFLARKKAECFKEFDNETIILSSDTVVINDKKIVNKPQSKEEAFEMLSSLSNKTHEVITGVCLKIGDNYSTFSDQTVVTFEDLNKAEIDFYIKNYSPMDKAGAYGVQDFIGMIGISKIEGSFYTVMGLPIHKVYKALKPFIVF
ncbi:septum formation protein Maf [Lacihabitans sp. LS3-19]|uniref:Maf family nucleotide pyrophosphatase n=1 Tax=Lacihabitans sp. LS3-19 TaxID=2487335 RepID=UPI0020CC7003|nr:Maf family nucleotide pyrophosphatase [Lacihabitans sp. LS3-19]MCP9767696.1 septum formation protein Maf [Lacihabitans sp. LS3-19]